MSVFLFVIDGLGIWNDKEKSTFENLKDICDISTTTLPFMYEIGFEKAIKGEGNLISPVSIVAGSLEGHREMMGHISNNKYDLCPDSLSRHIINEMYSITNISCIGNIKGRGRWVVPRYSKYASEKNIILYLGFDSTISIAYSDKAFSMEEVTAYANKLMEILYENNLKIRKIIIRQYDSNFIKINMRKEIFKKVNFDYDITNLGFSKIIINSKVQDILGLNCAEVKDCNHDVECIDFFAGQEKKNGFYFFNFPDFDYYAHKGDYNKCIETLKRFDDFIKEFWKEIRITDYIIITSDHGVKIKSSDLSNTHVLEDVVLLCLDKYGCYYFNGVERGLDKIYKIIQDIQHGISLSSNYKKL